jgi:hypothetical protein
VLRLRINVDVHRLRDGGPCWVVRERSRDGHVGPVDAVLAGFHTTWGATYIRAADGHAWMDYDGEPEHFHEGGLVIPAVSDVRVRFGWNVLPEGHKERVRESGVAIGGVNKARVLNALTPACTMYRWVDDGWDRALCPEVRFDGEVTSVQVTEAREHDLVGNGEPLLAWIEGSGKATI